MSYGAFSMIPMEVPQVETEYRRVRTKIPVPESLELLATLERYESRSMHGQLPVVWDKAQGFQVYDAWGNKWLDFTSTIFVTNTGHGNKRIIKALQDTLEKPLLHTYTYASRERAEFVQYIIENTPANFEKVFLLSAGTEAVECALKLMRMNGYKKGKKRPGVIAFEGNWHGRTLGAQMLGNNPVQKDWIGYHDPNIYHLPFPYPWCESALTNPVKFFKESMDMLLKEKGISPSDDLCGFVIETYQGWGALFYPTEYIQAVSQYAREHDLLLVFDEMQAGFGRTGKLFGYMHYNVTPDIICCGKGASSSLPLSIVLGKKEVMDLPEIGSMSSTHSANPMACSAGKVNLQVILEEGLVENSRLLGEIFHLELNRIKEKFPLHIRYVLGRGLVAGLIFIDPAGNALPGLCTRICERSMQKGLLVVHTGRESIKLAPPLMITGEALIEGVQVLKEAIAECIQEGADND